MSQYVDIVVWKFGKAHIQNSIIWRQEAFKLNQSMPHKYLVVSVYCEKNGNNLYTCSMEICQGPYTEFQLFGDKRHLN